MWRILLSEFLGDLRAQKTRVFLTTFAVAWGTVAVVLLVAMGEGLKRTMLEGLSNAGEAMFMIYGSRTTMDFEGLARGRQIRFTEYDVELLRRTVPHLDLISPVYGRWGVALRAEANRTTAYVEGAFPSYATMRSMTPATGRFLNERDEAEKRRVIFLGDALADRLFGEAEPVGNTVLVEGLPFTVVGVLEHKFQTAMNNGPDADRAIIPASTFRTLYGVTYVGHMLVRPRYVSRSDETKDGIYRALARQHRFHPEDRRALSIWDFIEEARMTGRIMLGLQIFLGLVGGFTLLVAGVGVANIMYVVVRERTREIGIKRATGARRRHIMAQFVFEAVVLALGGGLAGLVVAGSIVLGVASIPDKSGAMEFLANPALPWPVAIGTVATLCAIGMIAGLFPARRAALVDPVESLRYE